MTPRKITAFFTLSLLLLAATACNETPEKVATPPAFSKDHVYVSELQDIRLGDGVPLGFNVSVRWRIADYRLFSAQFRQPADYDSLILQPRQRELISNVANTFPSVDSVFSVDRQLFKSALKSTLKEELGEEGIEIKEIIIAKIQFPATFTQAMENVALNEQELERIRMENIVNLEKAEAAKKQAEADGKVAVAQAQLDGELQQIHAETEKSRRRMELEKAETASRVAEIKAKEQARKIELLSSADIQKKEKLDNLELKKQREFDRIALEKLAQQQKMENDKEMAFAQLCAENPNYASFIVNRELASKVQIAVLPTGQDMGMLGNVLKNNMTSR
ncbi:MAG: SPFH domain-containing protein [Bacteroidota bacterium]